MKGQIEYSLRKWLRDGGVITTAITVVAIFLTSFANFWFEKRKQDYAETLSYEDIATKEAIEELKAAFALEYSYREVTELQRKRTISEIVNDKQDDDLEKKVQKELEHEDELRIALFKRVTENKHIVGSNFSTFLEDYLSTMYVCYTARMQHSQANMSHLDESAISMIADTEKKSCDSLFKKRVDIPAIRKYVNQH